MKNQLVMMVALTAITSLPLNAQVKFGMKGGLNIAHQIPAIGMFANGHPTNTDGNGIKNFIGSLFSDIGLVKKLVLRPEAGISGEGFLVKQTGEHKGSKNIEERAFKLRYLNVPVHLLYVPTFFGGSFYIGAGPFGSILISGKEQSQYGDVKLKIGYKETDDFKKFDAGISGTAGIKLTHGLLIGSSYKCGLLDVTPFNTCSGTKNKNRVLSFFVGYNF